MSGQMKSFKQKIVDDFIRKVNLYEKPKPIAFDLRGYSKFISDNNLSVSEITPEIMAQFQKTSI